MKSLFLVLFSTLSLAGTGAVAAQPPAAARPANVDKSLLVETTAIAPGTNTTLSSPRVGGFVLDDKHRLAANDKISFRILEDRDPAITLPITDSGELEVPYLGRLKVTGKTCKELQVELKKLLEQDFYYNATVIIGLDAVSKFRGKAYLSGQVRVQGPIDIPSEEDFTVARAILRAGGFGEFANKRKVKLSRTLPDGTKKEEVLDMEEIIERGKTEKDKLVQDGDLIVVPEKVWNL